MESIPQTGIVKSNQSKYNMPGEVVHKRHVIDASAEEHMAPQSTKSPQLLEIDANTPDNWVPRHPDLIRLVGAHPLNCVAPANSMGGTSLDLHLLGTGLTPPDLAFVRSHGQCGRVLAEEFKLTVVNQEKKETVYNFEQLKALPREDVMCSAICAGMRRKELNAVKQTKGFNFAIGAWHSGIFTGIPLHHLLTINGVKEIPGRDQWVEFQGSEDLPHGKYETCVPLHRALDPANDILVAFEQNGEPLRPDHGYPVRIVVPGNSGGRWTKWCQRITVTDGETTSYYHLHDNKVLPPWVDATTPNLEAWFRDPSYTMFEAAVNSYIAEPRHGSVAPLSKEPLSLKGMTYCGGGREVTMVYISIDSGKEWRPCTVSYPGPPRHCNKFWCVALWEPLVPISAFDLFTTRDPEIVVRAYDNGMNTQPEHLTWSLLGYGNNCWYRVKVHRRVAADVPMYQFQHPVSMRSQDRVDLKNCTGWMSVEMRKREKLELQDEATPMKGGGLPDIPTAEVAKHSSPEDCWLMIDSIVYDITEYYKSREHPGGNASLGPFLGCDASDSFHAVGHSSAAKPALENSAIGQVGAIAGKAARRKTATNEVVQFKAKKKAEIVEFELVKKEYVNAAKTLMNIVLQGPEDSGSWADSAVGQHFMIHKPGTKEKAGTSRAYTPLRMTRSGTRALFDFSIKIYADGMLTPWLGAQEVGSKIGFSGPSGHVKYGVKDVGYFEFGTHEAQSFKNVAMLAGGTGIAPMLQLLRCVKERTTGKEPVHQFSLIYSVRNEDEIIGRAELEQFEKEGFLKLRFVISPERATFDLIKEVCGEGDEDSVGLVCGPDKYCSVMRNLFFELEYEDVATY